MKLKWNNITSWLAGVLAIAFCSCSGHDSAPDILPPVEPYSIAISVEGNSLATRTDVVDPDENLRGKQHVTRVQLYIYEADGEGDYTCVASEDVKWNHLDGAAAGLSTKKKNYTTIFQSYRDDTDYLFLAVGFDDLYEGSASAPEFLGKNSVEAFGNPADIAPVGSQALGGCFRLADGKDKALLAECEIFAGSRIFTKAQLKSSEAVNSPIELYRRVAGMAAYFKNLPAQIGGKKVDRIALRLHQSQNTSVNFLPRLPEGYVNPEDVEDDEYLDYVTSPFLGTDGDIISSYSPAEGDDGRFTLSGFMLPMAPSEREGVSSLELVYYSGSEELGKRRILYRKADSEETRSGTGIIDTPEPGDDSPLMHYPIRANHFYKIGTKSNPIDLSGQTAYIYIEIDTVWDEYYGGALDNEDIPGLGIDNDWGSHDGGSLD